jgi:hypothetical protein
MPLTDLETRLRAREERELQARIALGVKMLTNAGYAMIGGTFFKAVTEQHVIPPSSYVWAAAGIGFLAFALFISPMGSADDE